MSALSILIFLDLMDDEEEVLLALAETLSSFLDYAGGPTQAIHVLRPLEKLCLVEESTVREKVKYCNFLIFRLLMGLNEFLPA